MQRASKVVRRGRRPWPVRHRMLRPSPAAPESLDALAARVLPPLVDEVVAALLALPVDAQPHAVKPLRKLLGKLRDHLDLFAPVYPLAHDWRDLWGQLRAAIDEGYGHLGDFKDLYDSQDVKRREDARYDEAELTRRRDAVLAWRDRMVRPAHAENVRHLVAAPAIGSGWRKRSCLSPRFWGAPGPKADPDEPALTNLARLVRFRLREARLAWKKAARLRQLDGHDARATFHDARKRLRALVHVLDWFPELSSAPSESKPHVQRLTELVQRQGKILDRLNAADGGDTAELEQKWAKLRRWATRHHVDDVMRELRGLVRRG